LSAWNHVENTALRAAFQFKHHTSLLYHILRNVQIKLCTWSPMLHVCRKIYSIP